MKKKKVMKLATNGKRFGAFCIDAIIPIIVFVLLEVIICMAIYQMFRYGTYNNYGYGYDFDYDYEFGYRNGQTYGSGATMALLSGIVFILSIAYLAVQCVFFAKSQTMGKSLMGLQVVSSKDGKPVGFWIMLLRELIVKRASGVFALGYIWILIDERHRAWHDKILDTYVVDLKESRLLNEPETPAESKPVSALPAAAPASTPIEEKPAKPAAEAKAEEKKIEETKTEKPVEKAKEDKTAAEAKQPAEKKAAADVKVNMSMKKDELLKAAKASGAKVNAKMTKTEIIEAVEKVTAAKGKDEE